MARRQTPEEIQRQLDQYQKQLLVAENRLQRLRNRAKYVRNAKDRKRTHRLIQYGVAFEANDHRLAALTDVEAFTLVERLLDIPEVRAVIDEAIREHKTPAALPAPDTDAANLDAFGLQPIGTAAAKGGD